jgi:hypothetical protein
MNDDDDEQTRTNNHTLSGIRTHSLRVQAIKAYTSDRMATGTGCVLVSDSYLLSINCKSGISQEDNHVQNVETKKVEMPMAYLQVPFRHLTTMMRKSMKIC